MFPPFALSWLVPALLVAAPVSSPFPVHPHHPKNIVVGGAAGKIAISYFTVPYNAKHLENTQVGFSWHLGFAALKSEVPLHSGDLVIPAGDYKLDAVFGEDGWNFELSPLELAMAKMAIWRARGDDARKQAEARVAEMEAELTKAGGAASYRLAAHDYEAGDDEHLAMYAINRGYNTQQRLSDVAAGGVEFSLRVGFGDLHREIDLAEQFRVADGAEGGDRK